MTCTRPARSDDVEAILELGRETWRSTYTPLAGAAYVEEKLALWWTPEGMIQAVAQELVRVGEVDGTVAGMIMFGCANDTVHVWKLYVQSEFQRRGLGAMLLDDAIASCPAAERVTLAYMEGNESARAFYAREGFVESHREPESECPESVWVERDLRT